MEAINENIGKILSEITSLRKDILHNTNQVASINNNLSSVVKTLEHCVKEINSMSSRVSEMEKIISIQKDEIRYLKDKDLQKNIVMFNVPEENEIQRTDTTKTVIETFKQAGVVLEPQYIDDCYRIGKIGTKRPISIKLTTKLKKLELMNVKDLLFSSLGIRIVHDRTREDRQFYKDAYPYILELRAKNKNPKIRNGKILVDNNYFTLAEIKSMITKRQREEGETDEDLKRNKISQNLHKFAFRPRVLSESSKSNFTTSETENNTDA